jgi:hypothetical protein
MPESRSGVYIENDTRNSVLVLLDKNWLTMNKQLSKHSIEMNITTQPAHSERKVPIKHRAIYEIQQFIATFPNSIAVLNEDILCYLLLPHLMMMMVTSKLWALPNLLTNLI